MKCFGLFSMVLRVVRFVLLLRTSMIAGMQKTILESEEQSCFAPIDGAAAQMEEKSAYMVAHIPKNGMTSLTEDLVQHMGLRTCFGRFKGKNVDWNDDDWHEAMARGECNLIESEHSFVALARRCPWKPRLILLLREPRTHILSQFAHCQSEFDRKKRGNQAASLEHYLELSFARDNSQRRKICQYPGYNPQSQRLCDEIKTSNDISACQQVALQRVEKEAWFVGVLEKYDQVISLLLQRIQGIESRSFDVANRTHHSSWRDVREVTPRAEALLWNLTECDRAVYAAAQRRFARDAAIPLDWHHSAARHGFIWARGSDWRGQPWRNDPDTTSRGPQFSNGYTGAISGGPEYISTLYCGNKDRAPLPQTEDAIKPINMSIFATALDMEQGFVQRLWCHDDTIFAENACTLSQYTYAHALFPSVVESQFLSIPSDRDFKSRIHNFRRNNEEDAFNRSKSCLQWHLMQEDESSTQAWIGQETKAKASIPVCALGRKLDLNSGRVFAVRHAATTEDDYSFSFYDHRTKSFFMLDRTLADLDLIFSIEKENTIDASLRHHAAAFSDLRQGKGLKVEGSRRLGLLLNTSWYAVLNAAPLGRVRLAAGWGLSGIATNGFNGRTFWDFDTWCFMSLTLFEPLAARRLLEWRISTALERGRACAERLGYRGIDVPWSYANPLPAGPCRSEDHGEIHVNADISLAVFQFWKLSGDDAWFRRSRGRELVMAVADFFVSRRTPMGDGKYTFHNASGPDESSQSGRGTARSNSVYVAVSAIQSAQRALDCCADDNLTRAKEWHDLIQNTFIIFDPINHYHPEHSEYRKGTHIKQADVVMLHHPLQWPYEEGLDGTRNDLEAYLGTNGFLPMTSMPNVIGFRDVGNEKVADQFYLNLSHAQEGPFATWMEHLDSGDGTHWVTSKAPNYLTTAAGFLESTWAGYGGLRLDWRSGLLSIVNPRPPPGANALELDRVYYRGLRISVRIQASTLYIKLEEDTMNRDRVTPMHSVPSSIDLYALDTMASPLPPISNRMLAHLIVENAPFAGSSSFTIELAPPLIGVRFVPIYPGGSSH